jgi:hypothetical protein
MPTVKIKRKLKADVVVIPRDKLLDFFRQNQFPSLAPRKNKKSDHPSGASLSASSQAVATFRLADYLTRS